MMSWEHGSRLGMTGGGKLALGSRGVVPVQKGGEVKFALIVGRVIHGTGNNCTCCPYAYIEDGPGEGGKSGILYEC